MLLAPDPYNVIFFIFLRLYLSAARDPVTVFRYSTLYKYIITKINLFKNNEGTKKYVTKKGERLLICHEDLFACSWYEP